MVYQSPDFACPDAGALNDLKILHVQCKILHAQKDCRVRRIKREERMNDILNHILIYSM